ncbi:hypothetical protein [Maridesulfovibrio ferrireducens]|uniref:hypothetical protein n=1 Tax=Maridesulfovibrio ferrireducens TaxID=246191 RepID=UPI001A2B748E|nr:hypothetical protein [Maridesulfovibrio ferrireducens]MBI9113135.1 hypothetical protein [Maridesulfovibrio ferrireducens]
MLTEEEIAAEEEFENAFSGDDGASEESINDDSASDDDFNLDEADEGSPDEDPAPDQDDSAELSLEKKAHGYDSMLGRLEKERAEKARIQQELESLRAQQTVTHVEDLAPANQEQQKVGSFEIPEELQSDLDEIGKEDPQLVALFGEDSVDGKRLRQVLEDYGPDMAAIQAASLHTARQIGEQGKEIKATVEKTETDAHVSQIYSEVPDYKDLTTNPNRAQESVEYHQNLREWVSGQPYNVAAKHFHAIEQGTPQEVAALLKEFNSAKGSASSSVSEKTRQDADAALAVKSKNTPLPKSKGSKDDFDAGWDED